MLRLYDFECCECGFSCESLIDVPAGERPPKHTSIWCPGCERISKHDRVISLTAPYMGEKVLNPIVSGGKFDTVGREALPKLPTLPNGATAADYSTMMNKPEYKEIEKERSVVRARNKEKRKRHAALKRGENVNFRRDKCKGDPAITV